MQIENIIVVIAAINSLVFLGIYTGILSGNERFGVSLIVTVLWVSVTIYAHVFGTGEMPPSLAMMVVVGMIVGNALNLVWYQRISD